MLEIDNVLNRPDILVVAYPQKFSCQSEIRTNTLLIFDPQQKQKVKIRKAQFKTVALELCTF